METGLNDFVLFGRGGFAGGIIAGVHGDGVAGCARAEVLMLAESERWIMGQ